MPALLPPVLGGVVTCAARGPQPETGTSRDHVLRAATCVWAKRDGTSIGIGAERDGSRDARPVRLPPDVDAEHAAQNASTERRRPLDLRQRGTALRERARENSHTRERLKYSWPFTSPTNVKLQRLATPSDGTFVLSMSRLATPVAGLVGEDAEQQFYGSGRVPVTPVLGEHAVPKVHTSPASNQL